MLPRRCFAERAAPLTAARVSGGPISRNGYPVQNLPHDQIEGVPGGWRRAACAMWAVTTIGDLPNDHEERGPETPLGAWSDYHRRILELEISGLCGDAEKIVQYGRCTDLRPDWPRRADHRRDRARPLGLRRARPGRPSRPWLGA